MTLPNNTTDSELEEMLIVEFGFKKDDLVFKKLVRTLNNLIAQEANKARIDVCIQVDPYIAPEFRQHFENYEAQLKAEKGTSNG